MWRLRLDPSTYPCGSHGRDLPLARFDMVRFQLLGLQMHIQADLAYHSRYVDVVPATRHVVRLVKALLLLSAAEAAVVDDRGLHIGR